MKIDGMDASSMTNKNIPDTKEKKNIDATMQNVNTSPQSTNTLHDNKNLTHLSEFEKRELSASEKLVIDTIEKANKAFVGGNRRFEFSIHEKTKEIMIKVINSDTNEVVREIPPEKTLDMVAKMWEKAGILVDERR